MLGSCRLAGSEAMSGPCNICHNYALQHASYVRFCKRVCRATGSCIMRIKHASMDCALLQIIWKSSHVSPWICHTACLALLSTLPWSSVPGSPGVQTSLLQWGQGSLALYSVGSLPCSSSHSYQQCLPVVTKKSIGMCQCITCFAYQCEHSVDDLPHVQGTSFSLSQHGICINML